MNPFDIAGLRHERDELEQKMSVDGFWDDVENANKVNQRIKVLIAKIEKYEKLIARGDDLLTLIELADEEEDESMVPEVQAEYEAFSEAVEALKEELDENTVMLVKASHSMHFEVLTDLLQKHYD